MSYLNRDERRDIILQGAMRLALEGGFAAMTVRAIASEAGVSSGQVHHHFASIGELKAQAFIRLIDDQFAIEVVAKNASWREQLHAMLGSDDGRLEPYVRLWREGQILAEQDAEIKGAYILTMEIWHKETVAIITRGRTAGEFRHGDSAASIAWRLIGLVCGLDGICMLGIGEMNQAIFEQHLARAIALEVL